MFNWLIKLLGGYTVDDIGGMRDEIYRLHLELEQARKDVEDSREREKIKYMKRNFFVQYDDCRGHNIVIDKATREVFVPESLLEQARKNDTPRDPKTGRFVSKK